MKSKILTILLLATYALSPKQACALSFEHGGEFSNTDGSSRFSDSDDDLEKLGSGMMHFGTAQPGDNGTGFWSFGVASAMPQALWQNPRTDREDAAQPDVGEK